MKPGEQTKVCKLQKALYGLKQSARSWNRKIASILKKTMTSNKARLIYVSI